MRLEKVYPGSPSNEEAKALCYGAVDELGLLVEGNVEGTNQVCVLVPDLIVWLAVEFIADFVHALVEEEHLIDFFELLQQDVVGILLPWLQRPHQVHHETLVHLIVPSVEGVFVWIVSVWEREGTTE